MSQSESVIPYEMLATVDLGSNSFRLLISRVVDGQFYQMDVLKETVRLSAGLDVDKYLSETVQERALNCLAKFGERLRGFSPVQVRVVATNTFRVAKNIENLIKRGGQTLGFPIEVIAGREEARLIYLGAAQTLPSDNRQRLVIDIGGGSTEFIIGRKFQPLLTESLPLGCVTFSINYFDKGKLQEDIFNTAILAARSQVQRIRTFYQQKGWDIAVGTSGTARSISEILLQYDQGKVITRKGLEWLKQRLIKFGQIKKIELVGLKADRVPVLPGGLSVLIAVFDELNINSMSVTRGALRDGVLYDMLGRQQEQDIREITVSQFCCRYHTDLDQANRVYKLAEQLYRMVTGEDLDHELLKYLIWAARLHEIGISIAHTAYHKHSAYILQNADMPGFSRREQNILSILVMGHRGDLVKMLPLVSDKILWSAIISLRLSALFYRCRRTTDFPSFIDFCVQPKGFDLYLDAEWLENNPLSASDLRQEMQQWKKIKMQLMIIEK